MANSGSRKVIRLQELSPESVSPLFVELDIRQTSPIRGSFAVSELQGLQLVRSRTNGGCFEVFRETRHIQRTGLDAFYACVPMRGSVVLTQEGRSCTLQRGDIGIMDSRMEYSLAMPDDLDALWVRIDLEALETRLTTTSRFVARRMDGSKGIGHLASRFILAAASQADSLSSQRIAPVATIFVDLLSAAAATEDFSEPKVRRAGSRTLQRAKTFIEYHLGDEDLDPAMIAKGIGISTRYLSELFATDGTTTMEWTKLRRLELARMAFETTPWSPGVITETVLTHGFRNVASFNRSFRKAFGTTPTALMR